MTFSKWFVNGNLNILVKKNSVIKQTEVSLIECFFDSVLCKWRVSYNILCCPNRHCLDISGIRDVLHITSRALMVCYCYLLAFTSLFVHSSFCSKLLSSCSCFFFMYTWLCLLRALYLAKKRTSWSYYRVGKNVKVMLECCVLTKSLLGQTHLAIASCFSKLCLTFSV